MEKQSKVTVINATKKNTIKKIRVAPYCRVSSDSTEQKNSYDSQISYYEKLVEMKEEWELVEIYKDFGLTGTKIEGRDGFLKLINDAKNGKIDLIIVKSISRFARNVNECLQTIRDLKEVNVGIFFEKENINTLSEESELLLTIISKVAEEESLSISKNARWAIQKRFKDGTYKQSKLPYGYKRDADGKIKIDEEEAKFVIRVFNEYANGLGGFAISNKFYDEGVLYKGKHKRILEDTILSIIKNPFYVGDALYGKSFTTDTLPFKSQDNKGEFPKYYISENHAPIVSRELFDKAQKILQDRMVFYNNKSQRHDENKLFSQKIKCNKCNGTYYSKMTKSEQMWQCANKKYIEKKCTSNAVYTTNLKVIFTNTIEALRVDDLYILNEFINDIKSLKDNESSPNIDEIKDTLHLTKKQVYKLATLKNNKLIDETFYYAQHKVLDKKIKSLNDEIEMINKSNTTNNIISKTITIINTLNDLDENQEITREQLDNILEKIVPIDLENYEFHLINGLVFNQTFKSVRVLNNYIFSKKLLCGNCGSALRKTGNTYRCDCMRIEPFKWKVWECAKFENIKEHTLNFFDMLKNNTTYVTNNIYETRLKNRIITLNRDIASSEDIGKTKELIFQKTQVAFELESKYKNNTSRILKSLESFSKTEPIDSDFLGNVIENIICHADNTYTYTLKNGVTFKGD